MIHILRLLIRLSALAIVGLSLSEVEHPPEYHRKKQRFRWFGRARHRDELFLRKAVDAYLNLYVDYVLLEARTQGELQPFEGILIVKEQTQHRQPT